MSNTLQSMALWRRTLGPGDDAFESQRAHLRQALESFRERVGQLVSTLGAELPMLTVHDISHLDALWRVADEIAGPDYPLNAAEAFVLGGAILLHDAAHVLAAYPQGLEGIKKTTLWQDLLAQQYAGEAPPNGSDQEKSLVFQVLRHLHATQAALLPMSRWKIPSSGEHVYLLEDSRLRNHYGDLVGVIASSHHWPVQRVASELGTRVLGPPSFLPACWTVDSLKLALLLRTADAAHLDDGRAPWFLFALRQPSGISLDHWKFQSRMAQPVRTADGRLRLTAGAPFAAEDRRAWWLAFDTGRMIDRELHDAFGLLRDLGRPYFAAGGVSNVSSPEEFSKDVPVRGWEPVDVAPRVDDVPKLISVLGGRALYGDQPYVALRELMQNALDAVRALRHLGVMGKTEGRVTVDLTFTGGDWCLTVLDNGIGMSRHVLTHTLLDFGASLWGSCALVDELPGLARSGFEPVGKFGIGFYSVFMVSHEVCVTTRRFERHDTDSSDQWQLRFEGGLRGRPILMQPALGQQLHHSGTRIAIKLSEDSVSGLFRTEGSGYLRSEEDPHITWLSEEESQSGVLNIGLEQALPRLLAWLCPASDVEIYASVNGHNLGAAVLPRDWLTADEKALTQRLLCKSIPLVPITDEGGVILGRVGLDRHEYHWNHRDCAIVFHGIRCGELAGLAGLIEARENNADARRADAAIKGSIPSWGRWAERVIAATTDPAEGLLLRLHPLLPDRDFPIWSLGLETLTLEQLAIVLAGRSEVLVLTTLSHEVYDDVTHRDFNAKFVIGSDVLIQPALLGGLSAIDRFPLVLGVQSIDYERRLRETIATVWPNYRFQKARQAVVGSVGEVKVTRVVMRYSRNES